MCRRALPVVPAEGDLGFHAATAPDTKMQTTTPVSCCRMHLIPVHSKTLTADAPPGSGDAQQPAAFCAQQTRLEVLVQPLMPPSRWIRQASEQQLQQPFCICLPQQAARLWRQIPHESCTAPSCPSS